MDPMDNRFCVDPKLSTLLDVKTICTWADVVSSLRNYVTKKNLFDPAKMKVVCRNDELEPLIGISEFAILEIGHLLKGLVTPIQHTSVITEAGSSSSTSTTLLLKRKREDSSEDIQQKKKTSADCESNLEPGNVETFCKDDETSDAPPSHSTVTHTFVTLETYDVEFEPLSASDDESLSESESELMDLSLISQLSEIVTFVANLESDIEEYLADLSSEDSGSDSGLSSFDFDAEIGLLDNWQCSTCLSKNSPINRYCSKCFCTRNGWLNADKKGGFEKKRRKKRKPRTKRKKQKAKERIQHDKSNEKPCTSNDSSISKNTAENMCLLCCATPINSSIIHGNFAHSIACFQCASKLKERKSRCPICRRQIEKVVFNVL